jgi:hypothetical protein
MENALTLTGDMQLVLGLTVLTMLLFLFERLRADVVALVVLVLLGLTGLVAPEDLFNGFSGNAVISLIATMILGAGLDRTGALNRLAAWLLRRAHGVERRLLLLTSAIAGIKFVGDAEPVGDGAVPAGGLALSSRTGLTLVAPADADRGRDHDGRRLDHGRQLAADSAQRFIGLGQRQPALGPDHTQAAADVRAAADRHRAVGAGWRISISSARSMLATTITTKASRRRARRAISPACTASKATSTN